MTGEQRDTILILNTQEMPVAAFSVDSQRRITSWNETAAHVLQRRPEDVIGRYCHEVICGTGPGAPPFCKQHCTVNARARGSHAVFDVHVTTGAGETRWVAVGTMEARTEDGEHRLMHIIRDVTEHHILDSTVSQATATDAPDISYPRPRSRNRQPGDHPSEAGSASHNPLHLTPREAEVLRLLACGLTTADIAQRMRISHVTTRNHINRLIEKLGVKSRLQAVLAASRLGII